MHALRQLSLAVGVATMLSVSACSTTPEQLAPVPTCQPGQRLIQKGTPTAVCSPYYTVSIGDGSCGLTQPSMARGPAQGAAKFIVLVEGNVACAPPGFTYWMVRLVAGGYQVISGAMPNIKGNSFEFGSDNLTPPQHVHLAIVSAATKAATAKLAERHGGDAFTPLPAGAEVIYVIDFDPKG